MNKTRAPSLEELLTGRNWPAARAIIRDHLRRDPTDHYMLTKLSWVAACQRRGVEAIRYSLRALDSEPQCALALWNHAGALHVIGESAKARRVYRRLIAKGLVKLERGSCGCGGPLFANGLLADCHAQLARHAMKLGNRPVALREVRLALAVRKPGGQRVNPLPELRRLRRAIEQMG